MPIILGIDPGQNGALARLNTDDCTLSVIDMPTYTVERSVKKTHIDLELVKRYCWHGDRPRVAWIEEVWSSPQMGVASAFSFGAHYAGCKGVLVGLNIPIREVMPIIWKRKMKAPADKALSRARASELMPHCSDLWKLKTKDGRAEAAMIALFGALSYGASPKNPITPEYIDAKTL